MSDSTPSAPPLETDCAVMEWIKNHHDELDGYCHRLTNDLQEAENLKCDAISQAFLQRSQYNPDRGNGNVRKWVFRIARNTWLSEHRRRMRNQTVSLIEDADQDSPQTADDTNDPLVTLIERELSQQTASRIRAALDRLPPAEREYVELRFVAGHANEEIAAILQVSKTTVYRLWERVRERLRNELLDLFPRGC